MQSTKDDKRNGGGLASKFASWYHFFFWAVFMVAIAVFFVIGVGYMIYEAVSDGWEREALVSREGILDDVRFRLRVPTGVKYYDDSHSVGWQEDISEFDPPFEIEVTDAQLPPSAKDLDRDLVSRFDTDLMIVESSCGAQGCLAVIKKDDDTRIDVYVYRSRGSDDGPTLRCRAHLHNESDFTFGNVDGAIAYLKEICGSLEFI